MDSVTHGLFPYSIAAFLRRSRAECAAVLLGAIGPDFDVFLMGLRYVIPADIISHRGITHTIFFGFFTAAILLYFFSRRPVAGFLKRLFRSPVGLEFNKSLLGHTYAGLLFHAFLDSLTSRGIPLLYPLTAKRFSAELFSYIDPYLIALSGGVFTYLVLGYGKIGDLRDVGRKLFFVYLVAFLAVGGFRLYEKSVVYGAFPEGASVYATSSPFSWSVVVRGEEIGVYAYDSWDRNVTSSRTVARLSVQGEGAAFPFEQALAKAEKLQQVREMELDARAVRVEAYFDGVSKEWVLTFSDPGFGTEFQGRGSWGRTRSVQARVSEAGAR